MPVTLKSLICTFQLKTNKRHAFTLAETAVSLLLLLVLLAAAVSCVHACVGMTSASYDEFLFEAAKKGIMAELDSGVPPDKLFLYSKTCSLDVTVSDEFYIISMKSSRFCFGGVKSADIIWPKPK